METIVRKYYQLFIGDNMLMENDISIDINMMKRVIKLAELGEGIVNPKPLTGAVIAKGGKILGLGCTLSNESSSAELRAIESAGKNAEGAELYINMEPDFFSKSSLKIMHIIKETGIRRTIIAIENPKPSSCGRWIKLLRERGMEVKCGILNKEAQKINEIYIKYSKTGIPFTILKTPVLICDGIMKSTVESQWILETAARECMKRTRRRVMGIMAGIGTVLTCNPILAPINSNSKELNRTVVILDSLLRIPLGSAVFKTPERLIIACTDRADKNNKTIIEREGATVIVTPESNGMVDLPYLLIRLGNLGIDSLLIEGGCKLTSSVLKEDIADKIICFTSSKILEGEKDSVSSTSNCNEEAIELKDIQCLKAGHSLLIEGYNKRNLKLSIN